MPRPKSKAQKAREAKEEAERKARLTIQEFDSSSEAEEPSESETSEEEDEYGELLDAETDQQINKVLDALKRNDESIFNKEKRFFDDPEEAVKKIGKDPKHKPMYLQDYHRMTLLENGGVVDEEKSDEKTYVEMQKEDRDELLAEIDKQVQDSDEEDDFLQKKTPAAPEVKKTVLPDPEKDLEKFLQEYLAQNAWIPRSKEEEQVLNLGTTDKDEIKAEEKFDAAVEQFENVYNFRFEDKTSSEIISYARNQATMRRQKMNSRKKQRQKKQEKKEQLKAKHEENLNKKKQQKMNTVMDRLEEIKKAVGEDVDNELLMKVFGDSLLKDDFDEHEWDEKMGQIFDEQFYSKEKPEWDDDDEIMGEFYEQKEKEVEEKLKEEKDENEEGAEEVEEEEDEEEDEEEGEEDKEELKEIVEEKDKNKRKTSEETVEDKSDKKKTKKQKLEEKRKARKEKEALKKQAQELVERNMIAIEEEVEEEEKEERRKNGETELKFKYVEVEPETFGLTQKEILLADDKALNEFISLKKLAPWRDPKLVAKDKRKVSKARRLREWRKQTFGTEEGLK